MSDRINSKSELLQIIHKNGKVLVERFGVIKLGIFGSFVRNSATVDSDVDFFLEIQPEYKTLKNFVELSQFLESVTGRKIELVTPQSLNKFIGKHIINQVEYVSLAA
jgi:predicted nucleotidyltransferase